MSSDVNVVVFSGKIAYPPRRREFDAGGGKVTIYVQSHKGRKYTSMKIEYFYKDQDEFVGLLAEGVYVTVSGELENTSYENDDGQRIRQVIIHAYTMTITKPIASEDVGPKGPNDGRWYDRAQKSE